MILNYLFFGSLVAAVTLIAFSAWLASRFAYIGILMLLATAFVLAELRDTALPPSLVGIGLNIVIFGAFVYFVTVQYLLNRKVTDVARRDEFKDAMIASNRFTGAVKVIYHLPVALLVAGVCIAIVGALQSK
jgi:hypothetical protein